MMMGASSSKLATEASTLRVCASNSSRSTSPLWSVSISSKTFETLSSRRSAALSFWAVGGSGTESSCVMVSMAVRSSLRDSLPSPFWSSALNCSTTASLKAPPAAPSSASSALSSVPSKTSTSAVELLVTVIGFSASRSATTSSMPFIRSANSLASSSRSPFQSAASKTASKKATDSGEAGGTSIFSASPSSSGRSSTLESLPDLSTSSSLNISAHISAKVPGASSSFRRRRMRSPSKVALSTTTGVRLSPAAICARTPHTKPSNSASDTSPLESASISLNASATRASASASVPGGGRPISMPRPSTAGLISALLRLPSLFASYSAKSSAHSRSRAASSASNASIAAPSSTTLS
mmetsp:Transcript_8141/g.32992  ORF Transcript_8141/g.32992 Transcript_8141/m.32992 type:complete len:354 (-) Transcript_8141:224-1285(-)